MSKKFEPRTVIFKATKWQLEEDAEELFIHVTGMTQDQKSVHIRIEGFNPFVFLELPDSIEWRTNEIKTLLRFLKRKLPTAPKEWKYEVKNKCRGKIPAQFLKLSFPENDTIRKLGYLIYNKEGVNIRGLGNFSYGDFRLHEHNIDTIIKYATIKKLKMAGWMKVQERLVAPDNRLDVEERKFTTCDIDMPVYYKNVEPVEGIKTQINPKIFSYDIESYSVNKNSKSPDPTQKENCTFQIAVTCGRMLDPIENFDKYLLSLNRCPDIEGTTVRNFPSEEKLLIGFANLIHEINPDVIIGYNILKYDWGAILTRAAKCGCYMKILKCGRIYGKRSEIESIKWSSSAYGQQNFNYLNPDGRINIDIYPEVERNYKLDSYSLDAVSEHFLGEHKEDMPYKQMFTMFEMSSVAEKMFPKNNDEISEELLEKIKEKVKGCMEIEDFYPPEEGLRNYVYEAWQIIKDATPYTIKKHMRNCMKKIGTYCVQDTILPIKLFHVLHLWDGLEQLANVTCIPMWYLQTRGQQVKVLAQYYRRTLFSNVVIEYRDSKNMDEEELDYQGATVIEAHPGCYELIATLDFASLYPSIMIAFNICHTTEVHPDDTIPDEECHVIEWDEHINCSCPGATINKSNKKRVLCGHHRYRFKKVKELEDGTLENEGLIPRMLKELLGERKKVKGQMKGIEKELKGIVKDIKDNASDQLKKKMKDAGGDKKRLKNVEIEMVDAASEELREKIREMETDLIVLDALQKGLKVSANSTYGFLGAKKGYCPLPAGAACVTAKGREMIKFTAQKVIEKYDCAKIVYGDTDSVMVHFRGKTTKEVFRLAQEAADYVTSFFPPPVELEFESVYDPYILLTKKRYMGNEIDPDDNIKKEFAKGVVLARRDNCHYLRESYREIVDLIRQKSPEHVVMNRMVDLMNDLFHMCIPYNKFILFKGLKEGDTFGTNQNTCPSCNTNVDSCICHRSRTAHVMLSRKMNSRGDMVESNTRLKYVFLKLDDESGDVKQGDKAEDWTYFLENRRKLNLKIDYLYYFEKQFINPLSELISVMYPKGDMLYEKPDEALKRQITIMDTTNVPDDFNWERLSHIRKTDDKITFIKQGLKREDFPDLFNACDRYKADQILTKIYKKYGLKKRLAKRPKKGEVTIRKDCKLMSEFYENHVYYHKVVNQLNDLFSPVKFE